MRCKHIVLRQTALHTKKNRSHMHILCQLFVMLYIMCSGVCALDLNINKVSSEPERLRINIHTHRRSSKRVSRGTSKLNLICPRMCGGVQRADRRRACIRDGRAKSQSVSCFGVCLYVRARVCVVFVAQCAETPKIWYLLYAVFIQLCLLLELRASVAVSAAAAAAAVFFCVRVRR